MEKMAEQSSSGHLTSFSGVFNITDISTHEKEALEHILHEYSHGTENISGDLTSLISITCEVKAITNQAILLHGERIKKAHKILTTYKDGAFSAWLMTIYGNRQTPYNFLQYYEFFNLMPPLLHPKIELMPRQAIYTLASREGSLNQKQTIVENYKGESKQEVLNLIREIFPLDDSDKRKQNPGETTIQMLRRLQNNLSKKSLRLTKNQKEEIVELLKTLQEFVSVGK